MKKTYIAPFVTKVLFVSEQIVAASITKIGGDVPELEFGEGDAPVEADVKGTIFEDEEELWDFEY